MQHVSMARRWQQQLLRDRWLYLMLLPGIIFFLVYKYLPMWGVVIAFQNYSPGLGLFQSEWVGLKHFNRLFSEPTFWMLFRNTILLSAYQLIFFFPIPIVLALMLNELRNQVFKRFVQTVIYIPHFVSWVVIAGISYLFLTPEGGFINELFGVLGLKKVNFLMSTDWFRPLQVTQVIWKEAGWGTIIFLAALAGVDPQLYEAAKIDGANRWRQLWHITLPALRSTIVILFILKLGDIMEQGAEHILLLLNAVNREVGEVFDTYVYTAGLLQGNFSYSAAVGLFKSLVGLILVLAANYLAKKSGEEGVF
ncbi:protein lplB [Paenibacillus sp. Soil766]|uniref:ABC transporter permease n=1 Tax=Paenibacillus sp. Soil766 TaxID=1736404 RepID=UPI00070EC710|nr:sugar ABC transporter permease [Paenibacillus sp. Soil766]KRF06807.1 protein lplB [Paenibacillus sp. Soil766]